MVSSKILQIDAFLKDQPKNTWFLVAYSGGADSTALLNLFFGVENVRAIHINHGISSNAEHWQSHCQKFCDSISIPLIIEKASLKDASENSCRLARYAFFEKHLMPNEVLLTAHHADDQAENTLLKLFRGTGLKGLSTMQLIKSFANGYIARPLLKYRSSELKKYLIVNGIEWIEDESNQQNHYKRNFIRNKLIPEVESQFPKAVKNIINSADNVKNSLALLNHLCAFDKANLSIEKLKNIPEFLQITYFYHWLSLKNLPVMDKKTIKQVLHDFLTAKQDKNPKFKNNYYQLYRWQGAIYCIDNFEVIGRDELSWNTEDVFIFPNNCGRLEFKDENLNLIVKFQQKGQKIQTHQHQFNKTVKKLFQENNIPPWQRQNTPFIYFNDKLISLGFEWSHSIEFNNKIKLTLKNII